VSDDIHIGQLRERLTLQAASRSGDGGGGSTVTWVDVASIWARVTPRGGGESVSLDRTAGRVGHEVVIRYRDDIVPAMRFVLGARVLDIKSACDVDGRRQWLRCLVEEKDL